MYWQKSLPKGLIPALLLVLIFLSVGFFTFQREIAFVITPKLSKTLTPLTQPAPLNIGDYDVLGAVVDKEKATNLLQTESGRKQLSPENGAVAITQELIDLGRKAFYSETFSKSLNKLWGVGE